jgi:WD40 repeat protein
MNKEITLAFPDRHRASPRVWTAHSGSVLGLAYVPDGQTLMSVGSDGDVRFWSGDLQLIRSIDWQIGELGAVAIAPDGLTAAVGGAEDIVIWDLE